MPKLKKKTTKAPSEDWSERPDGPVVIDVGLPGDGAVYELSSRFRFWLENAHPKRRPATDVFLGIPFETEQQFESGHRPYWEYIALMLTGLSCEELRKFGGLRIVEPVTEREWCATFSPG
jgi:hypothetical protein